MGACCLCATELLDDTPRCHGMHVPRCAYTCDASVSMLQRQQHQHTLAVCLQTYPPRNEECHGYFMGGKVCNQCGCDEPVSSPAQLIQTPSFSICHTADKQPCVSPPAAQTVNMLLWLLQTSVHSSYRVWQT